MPQAKIVPVSEAFAEVQEMDDQNENENHTRPTNNGNTTVTTELKRTRSGAIRKRIITKTVIEEEIVDGEDDKAENKEKEDEIELPENFESSRDYWIYRLKNSNILHYLYGDQLTVEETNDAVNALSLVNALVLTIPFGVIMGLNSDYWDWLQSLDTSCMNYSPEQTYDNVLNLLYACAYSSMMALIIALLYYIFRPTGKYFRFWWRTAKWPVLIMFLLTITSIASMLSLFGNLSGYFALPSDPLCARYHENDRHFGIAVTFLGIVLFCSLTLLL